MSSLFVICILVFFVGIGIGVIRLILQGGYNKHEDAMKALVKSKSDYYDSLTRLKATPTDANLKELTLAFGRAYSILSRSGAGSTTVDEISLMNDINAACAAASVTSNVEATSHSLGASPEKRLRTLTDLRDKNLVDSVEYEKRRSEILNSI